MVATVGFQKRSDIMKTVFSEVFGMILQLSPSPSISHHSPLNTLYARHFELPSTPLIEVALSSLWDFAHVPSAQRQKVIYQLRSVKRCCIIKNLTGLCPWFLKGKLNLWNFPNDRRSLLFMMGPASLQEEMTSLCKGKKQYGGRPHQKDQPCD